jgi:hypothetical protein
MRVSSGTVTCTENQSCYIIGLGRRAYLGIKWLQAVTRHQREPFSVCARTSGIFRVVHNVLKKQRLINAGFGFSLATLTKVTWRPAG